MTFMSPFQLRCPVLCPPRCCSICWPGCLWLRLLYLSSESWAVRVGLDFHSPSPLYIFVHIHKIIRLKEENGYGDREYIKGADDTK